MDDFLITRPPNARGIYLPQEYLLICKREKSHTITRGERKGTLEWITEYDAAAASILRVIERWTVWKIAQAEGPIPPDSLWVYIAQAMLMEWDLVGAFSAREITAGLDLLITQAYLERRNNPNKKWDRTYQYRFNKAAVQDAIHTLPPFFTIEEWKFHHQKMQPSPLKNAIFDGETAIPQVPTQVPIQEPSSVAADAARLVELEQELQAALKRIQDLEAEAKAHKDKTPKVPAEQMNPMKDAIVAAFGWNAERMTRDEWSVVQIAAQQLCLAKAVPADVPGIYAYCNRNFDHFTPAALKKHLSEYRKTVGGNGHAKPQISHGPGTEPVKPRIAPRVLGVDYGDTPTPVAATPAPGGG